jgi:tetratricopeptide (TPR) repeat protein
MAKAAKKSPAPLPDLKQPGLFPFSTFRIQLLLLLFIGILFYANSLGDEYALDDGVMIKENTYVLEGTKGLGKIFSKHSMAAYYEKNHARDEFEGGRYRPLSIASFAIEQSLFGMNPGDEVTFQDEKGQFKKGKITGLDAFFVNMDYTAPDGTTRNEKIIGSAVSTFHTETTARHFTNVLLYLLTIGFVFYLLREQIFRGRPDLGFLCALIFAIHPIHTEVVDNIKSRDELMALLFLIMSFVFAFKHVEKKNILHLFLGMASLFLALLSKEYGVVMFALLPLFFYIIQKKSAIRSLSASLPYYLAMFIYFFIRFKIIPFSTSSGNHASEILNNQYIAAAGFEEKFATKIYVLSKYLWLLIFPKTLCVDYSYNQIPFITFKDWHFWFSLVLHAGIFAATVVLFLRRHILTFFLLFYLAHLFLISNLAVEIGTTLGERLIYLPSFAYCVIFGFGLYALIEKFETFPAKRMAILSVCSVLTLLCLVRVFTRNSDWKNDSSIFTHDLALAPNSVLVNGNAGKAYIDMSNLPENKAKETELVKKAIPPLMHALSIHPTYVNGYLNLGVAYYKLGMWDSTFANCMKSHDLNPRNPLLHQFGGLFVAKGLDAARKKDMKTAIEMLSKATALDQDNADDWANLGGAYYTEKDYSNARSAWEMALKLDPNHQEARRGYQAIQSMANSTTPKK